MIRHQNNIETDFKEIGRKHAAWIHRAEGREQKRALVNIRSKLWVLWKAGNLLISWSDNTFQVYFVPLSYSVSYLDANSTQSFTFCARFEPGPLVRTVPILYRVAFEME